MLAYYLSIACSNFEKHGHCLSAKSSFACRWALTSPRTRSLQRRCSCRYLNTGRSYAGLSLQCSFALSLDCHERKRAATALSLQFRCFVSQRRLAMKSVTDGSMFHSPASRTPCRAASLPPRRKREAQLLAIENALCGALRLRGWI